MENTKQIGEIMTTDKTKETKTYITFDHTDNPVQIYREDIALYKNMLSEMFIKTVKERRSFDSKNNGVTHKETIVCFKLALPKLGVEEVFSLTIEAKKDHYWERWLGKLTNHNYDDLLVLRTLFRNG